MTAVEEGWSLHDVRAYLHDRRDDGVRCPACDQHVKVYRRKVYAAMAGALVHVYKHAGAGWVHVPSIPSMRDGRDAATDGTLAKLRYWGLVEEETSLIRDDGGRAGYWRVTDSGAAYITCALTIPKYALIYNSERIGFDGPDVLITDAFRTPFDYIELLRGQ